VLQDTDTKQLFEWTPKLVAALAKVPGFLDVNSDMLIANPQLDVTIDRDAAAAYGVTPDAIENALYDAFGPAQVSTIYTSTDQFWVLLQVDPKRQADPNVLSSIYITGNPPKVDTSGAMLPSSSQLVPLSAVTKFGNSVGAATINHLGQVPAVTVSFNLAPGFAIGDATEAIRNIERDSNLPATVTTGFQGNAQVFEDSLKGQGILILAAIFAAFVVLGILYESFIHPITIISGLPSAGIGALLTLILFRMELSVIAMIGIVMLVGIVKKNAIMMVDFAIERRRVGLVAEAAIREACLLRFRPIMMTTFAAIFGALPIALGSGEGAELRQPLGIAVVGGLMVSQLLTLYITPVIYLYLDRVDRVLKRRLEPQLEEVEDVPQKSAVAAE
jgi:HAE1 family hydrophobic/amphiphilic exporter-1